MGHQKVEGGVYHRAMRAYALLAKDARVREAQRRGTINIGDGVELAELVRDELGVHRATAYRYVRCALDVLGVGEFQHPGART